MKRNKVEGVFAFQCDIGKVRKTNEDRAIGLIDSYGNVLLCVADGMGGHKKGEYASNKIVEILKKDFKNKDHFSNVIDIRFWLGKEVKKINKELFELQDNDIEYKGMGSTLCLAIVYKRKLIVLNVGDSRCYLLKNEKLIQLTEDQSYVNYLVHIGKISKEEALTHPKRHYLTNAIGIYPTCSYDLKVYDYHGETIFLCSDGVYNNVSFNDIEANLNSKHNAEDKVHSLINLGNYNGGSDNMSCVIWEARNVD